MREPFTQQPHLRVVRRDDSDVVVSERPLPVAVPEGVAQEVLDLRGDRLRFFLGIDAVPSWPISSQRTPTPPEVERSAHSVIAPSRLS